MIFDKKLNLKARFSDTEIYRSQHLRVLTIKFRIKTSAMFFDV